MKQNIVRISFVSLVAVLFLTVMFYPQPKPMQISVSQKPSLKVKTKVVQKKESTKIKTQIAEASEPEEQIEPKEPIKQTKPQIQEENQQEPIQTDIVQQFDQCFDLDSTSETITAPIIDLKTVYSKIVYPISMKKKNIQARFDIRVYVSKNGDVSINIPKSVQTAFSDVVSKAFSGIRAVPAQYKGKNVDVTFSIPMTFELK